VLLLTDRIDEWVVNHLVEFKGKTLASATSVEALPKPAVETPEDVQQGAAFHDTLERIKKLLEDKVSDVKLSHGRLTESPACLVDTGGLMGRRMEKMLRDAGQSTFMPSMQPVLELNPMHPLVAKLKDTADEALFGDLTQLLYGQAVLAEGGKLDDPAAFVKRLNALILGNVAVGSRIIVGV
jgi:molecular chaperone HtpG